MTYKLQRTVSLLLMLLAFFGVLALAAAGSSTAYAAGEDKAAPQLQIKDGQENAPVGSAKVNAGDTITVDTATYGFTNQAIQKSIDAARGKGTAAKPVTIKVPAGTYTFSNYLNIYSNISLVFESGAVLNNGGWCMVYARGDSSPEKGYNGAQNYSISGGIWNAGSAAQPFTLLHSRNAVVSNLTITGSAGHTINCSASEYVTIRNVTFKDMNTPANKPKGQEWTIESIHTDTDTATGEPGAANDGTPAGNILVENCTFDNVWAGVGKHGDVSKDIKNGKARRYNGTALTVRNCTFRNIKGNVIDATNMDNVVIERNTVSGTAPQKFVWTKDTKNLKILSNKILCSEPETFFESRGGTGTQISGHARMGKITIQENSSMTLSNGAIEKSNSAGIGVWSGSTATIKGVTITNPKGQGIAVTSAGAKGGVTVQNCIIKNASNDGIYLDNVKNSTITGTTIMGSKRLGILVTNSNNVSITNNVVQDTVEHGVMIDSGCSKVTITGNVSNSNKSIPSKAEFLITSSNKNITLKNNKYGPRQFWIDTKSITQSNNRQYSYNALKVGDPEVSSGIWRRVAGASKFDTMRQIASEGWASSTGGTVILATAASYQDALSAAALAGMYKAPILVTDYNRLTVQTKAELDRIRPSNVIIVGGRYVVTPGVESAIKRLPYVKSVDRRAGARASDTAADIARTYFPAGTTDTAILASSQDFRDALSASPIAYAKGYPIFLVDSYQSISKNTLEAMREIGITKVMIVGGKWMVDTDPSKVINKLKDYGVTSIDRKAGGKYWNTSHDIALWGLSIGLSVNKMGVATGYDYSDALCGAALCGKNNSILVLACNENSSNVDSSSSSITRANRGKIWRGYVYGGRYVVEPATFNKLEASMR